MAYPKPLSERNIAKMYAEAGISEEEKKFLHDLFEACANLYGAVSVQDIYDVYDTCAETNAYPLIRRSKLLKFSAIARRETLPWYVFEVNSPRL